jgi:hypothetical protein
MSDVRGISILLGSVGVCIVDSFFFFFLSELCVCVLFACAAWAVNEILAMIMVVTRSDSCVLVGVLARDALFGRE